MIREKLGEDIPPTGLHCVLTKFDDRGFGHDPRFAGPVTSGQWQLCLCSQVFCRMIVGCDK
ncbi:hypothetical protein Snas_3343 [Stackebrandtia nassauensis DSM 44728]|uniref:Uncharacterized protein n=1 Tax=Stackebrandtia nassauensis (strain DSM 44728 / CIP 108903 / NRRL B-16338 / NBRC 102104 / LLR-40K-21) TaxID=446470 RepID=D3PUJ6_STANL|nr:hypothetical protein Snas_3343 [Stackebrandtia nassauensis DSM 44728]